MSVPTTEVTGYPSDIPGLLTFDVTRVGDDRGWFQEKFHKAKLVAAGMPEDFAVVQNSIAFNKKGVTRGLHAEPWDKYVSIVNGEAFVAYVDLRKGESFGKVVTLTLTPDKAVYVPAGVANSYQALTDDLYYIYSVNQHWTPDAYERYSFVNLGDPELNIQWPIPLSEAILSDKDRNHPVLKDAKPLEI
ncbi:MAG TPA: dTDP-4-dehydrorhamnose 3,5-epimerase family protein [Candidatus Saccharimonadales bacterium]|jgi:dTDP-4-dehydrorhamnose 3,5-epimerase|nr:dTDP-4-dehydrorhamnose 3,5-epimerase family protein [Candidatus Saccharimonadales bacterium]